VRAPATITANSVAGQAVLYALGTTTANSFQACDVGRTITGTGIPAGAKIASFISAKVATMTVAATAANAAAKTLGVGNLTFQVNNSRARDVGDATISSGSNQLTSAAAKFLTGAAPAGDVGNVVSGTCIPDGTTILSVSGNVATISANATCAEALHSPPDGTQDLSITLPDGMQSTARIVTDATIVGGKFHSPSANFLLTDKGTKITKAGVSYLVTGTTATDATVTPVPANNATPAAIQVGNPTITAPANGDFVAQQASTLQLQSTLVAGSKPCASGALQGTTIDGAWYNPGAFIAAGGSTGLIPKVENAEIVFPTSVVSFAAFVAPRAANSTDEGGHVEAQTAAHMDITFPSEPLGVAVCPGTTVSSDFTFVGTSLTQQRLPTGTGQPSTAVVRGIQQVGGVTALPAQDTYITLGGGTSFLAGDPCSIDPTMSLATFAGAFPCGS